MTEQHRPDDLAQLRAELATQRSAFAALRAQVEAERRPRRRFPRRYLSLALVGLLVALLPFAILAATPFTDLTGGSHDGNIDAIFNAGITKGCDPPAYVSYCPTANVTREEMASFLARTAGLGGNPPIANALTAVTAQTATSATNAANAGNANTVDGLAPSGLVRVARGGVATLFSNLAFTGGQTVAITAPAPGFVLVTATVNARANGGAACPQCEFHLRLLHAPGTRSPVVIQAFANPTAYHSATVTAVFAVAAGPQTVQLETAKYPSALTVDFFNPTLTALYVPFGATGGATLAETDPAGPQPDPITVP